jgi:hypothetical protein
VVLAAGVLAGAAAGGAVLWLAAPALGREVLSMVKRKAPAR